jgi:hypothetical protein
MGRATINILMLPYFAATATRISALAFPFLQLPGRSAFLDKNAVAGVEPKGSVNLLKFESFNLSLK